MSSYRKCPPDKIRNPKTGHCVLRSGKIGQKLIQSVCTKCIKLCGESKITIKCPPDKILNPETNRCVLRSGKIGQKILQTEKTPKKKTPKRKPKKTSKQDKYNIKIPCKDTFDPCSYKELKKITVDTEYYNQNPYIEMDHSYYEMDHGYYEMENLLLYRVRKLGEGSFGMVHELVDDPNYTNVTRKYAIKELMKPDDDEISIIRDLESRGMFDKSKLCSIIIAHVIDSYRIVMCPYENNLRSITKYFVGPEKDNYIRAVFKQLVEVAKCLYDNWLVYIDYKCENILYKCINGSIKVHYADLGSLVYRPTPENELKLYTISSTFSDPSSKSPTISYVNDKLMVWGIAITCLDLFSKSNKDVSMFLYHCYIAKRSNYKKAKKIIEGKTISSLFPEDISNLLAKMLVFDKDMRPNLEQLIELMS